MKSDLLRRTASVFVLVLVGVVFAPAQAGQKSADVRPSITAERMEARSNGWYRAIGNVSFCCEDQEMRADQVDFNSQTGQVNARGHVELLRPAQGRWVGDSIDYNYITKEGLTGLSESKPSALAVVGEEVETNAAVLTQAETLLFEATCKSIAECFAKDDLEGFLKLCLPRDLLPQVVSQKQLATRPEAWHRAVLEENARRFKDLRNKFQDMREFAFSSAEVGRRIKQSALYADLNPVLKNANLSIAYTNRMVVRIKIEDMVQIGGQYYVIKL
jgi:hypothetical protein